MKKTIAAIIAAILFLTLASTSAVRAETGVPEEPQIPQPQIHGRVEGTGTHFELTNSQYLNIILDSSQPIKLILESVPEMVSLHLESASGATSTDITLGGFLPSTTYHKYEDDHHNRLAFTTDASGKYTYTQDLSRAHLVFIQPRASTIYLSDSGWSKPVGGVWIQETKTAILMVDLNETIQIDSDNITLIGNGHMVSGTGQAHGVYLSGRTGVTIKNLNVRGFTTGIYLYSSSNNTLTGNTLTGNEYGIYLHYLSSGNNLTGNTASSNNKHGIFLTYLNDYNTLSGNTASANNEVGIYLEKSRNNTLTGNTARSNNYYGIYLNDANNNELTGNTASSNINSGIRLVTSSGNTLTSNTAASNDHGIYLFNHSDSNTLTSNLVDLNSNDGIYLSHSSGNTLTRNHATGNSCGIRLASSRGNTLDSNQASSNNNYGIFLGSFGDNTLTSNTVDTNSNYGIYLNYSSNNQVYNNNFIRNPTQAYVSGGTGNVFNLNKPTGGNFWSNWTRPDSDNDGFVDSAFGFTGGQDNLPWTNQDGWVDNTMQTGWVDNTPPTTTISLAGTLGNNGWYTSDVQVTLTATDNSGGSGIKKTEYSYDGTNWNTYTAPFTVSNEGSTTIHYRSTDNQDNVEATKTETIKIDKTAPAITASRTPAPNSYGWNNTDVTATYTASDGGSGLASPGTGSHTFSSEGAAQSHTFTVTDLAGNSASRTISNVNIDKTAPELTFGNATPTANPAGWNNTDVSVPFTTSDKLSGVASTNPASSPLVLTGEGLAVTGTVTVTDKAGNSANFTTSPFKIDKTPPVITGSRTPTPNANGWNNTDVTVKFTATDSVSGIASVTPDTTVSAEGQNQSVTGAAVDVAGNSASATVSNINVDKTKPTLNFGIITPAPNASGWNNADVTIAYTNGDSLSGVDSSSPASPLSFTADGANQTKTVTVTDKAGNSETFAAPAVNLDKTPPTITASRTPGPDASGWNNTDVTVHFTATDTLSEVDSVSPDVIISAEGGGQSATGTASDKAGNTASLTVSDINIDKTPPALTFGTATPAANAAGWNNTNVSMPFTASDNLSGVASTNPASSPLVLTGEGLAVTGTVTVTDKAGNSANFTTSPFKIDKTPPVITGSRTPTPNANGWNNTDVTVKFTATDSLSGIASVTPDTTVSTEGQNQSVTGTAVDVAGNSASATVSNINVDKTKPTLTFGIITPAPNASGWHNADVTIAYTNGDSLSGVDSSSPASPLSFTADGANQTKTVTVTDKAGNSEIFTSPKVSLDKTKPGITINVPQAKEYLSSETITLSFSASDATSGVVNISATLDGSAVTNGQVINLASMAGNHSLTVSATDKAGNADSLSVAFSVVIAAAVDIDPNTLNLKSQSDKNAITAYIEIPAGYDVTQINVATVKLNVNGTLVNAQLTPTSVGDYDKDGVADRMVKFDRQAVITALAGKTGDVTMTVSGQLTDGQRFSGTDTIKVINPGK